MLFVNLLIAAISIRISYGTLYAHEQSMPSPLPYTKDPDEFVEQTPRVQPRTYHTIFTPYGHLGP